MCINFFFMFFLLCSDVAPVVNMGVRTGDETVKMDRDGFLIIPGDKSVTATKRSQSTLVLTTAELRTIHFIMLCNIAYHNRYLQL